jgi:YbgC/YbaW family acyl-CoA thioester hydrolase
MHELKTTRRVEFADTDLAGVVHFSRFFVYMESVEGEFLRALGADFTLEHEGSRLGWPKAEAACEYVSPARYGDVLDIHLRVQRKGNRSVIYAITFRCGGREIARGRTVSVCCAAQPGGGFAPIRIPEFIAGRIEQAPE